MTGYLIIAIVYFVNVMTFLMFASDKHRAVVNIRRIPEFYLLLFTVVGGSLGALMGMWMFRHKTLHKKFTILVPVFFVTHTIILFVLGYIVDVLPDVAIS